MTNQNTGIEWTDTTWNPVTGCTKVSKGCDNCYAEKVAERFRGTASFPAGFDLTLRPDRIDDPLHWRKPRLVFVNSMSDLFHDDVPDLFLTQVFDVMEQATAHTFQVLTKRHARMRAFLRARQEDKRAYAALFDHCPTEAMRTSPAAQHARQRAANPPANIWLGVSVESQAWADIRIPALLDTPAAVRFLSCEPLLGPVDLDAYVARIRDVTDRELDAPDGALVEGMRRTADQWHRQDRLHWVIVGGESGPGARPMHPRWARELRDQCTRFDVPFFFKQWGAWQPGNHAGPRHPVAQVTPDGKIHSIGWVSDRVGTVEMTRVGKKAAGRLLDGATWDQMPAAAGRAGP